MSKHTPGPWRVNEPEDSPSFMEIIGPSIRLRFAVSAPDVTFEQSLQREADARLIAAAPELLAALKDVTERYWRSIILGGTDPEFADIAVAQFRAVIAKAEGQP